MPLKFIAVSAHSLKAGWPFSMTDPDIVHEIGRDDFLDQ